MKESLDLKMLQYYRHDIMNELQLVHGYLQMGKVDQANETITNWIHELNEERKLMYLNAPQFISWIMFFNHVHNQMRLTYAINIEASLNSIDSEISKHCYEVIRIIEKNLTESKLVNIHIELTKSNDSQLLFKLFITGLHETENIIMAELTTIGQPTNALSKITKENSEIICIWQFDIRH